MCRLLLWRGRDLLGPSGVEVRIGMEVCGEVELEVVTNCDVEGIAAYDLMSVGRGI